MPLFRSPAAAVAIGAATSTVGVAVNATVDVSGISADMCGAAVGKRAIAWYHGFNVRQPELNRHRQRRP